MGPTMTQLTSSWQFWAFLAALFAALTAVFAKIGVSEIHSNYATLLRTLVVVAVLAMIVGLRGEYQSLSALSAKSIGFLALSGLATGASWLCYFKALKMGNASQVAPIDKLSVVFVAIFAALFLGEKLSWTGWSGVLLIALGAVLVAVS